MVKVRGMGSTSMTNQNTCGGNIKGGLAPTTNSSANSHRAYVSTNPATMTQKDLGDKCVSGDKYHPKYCCPVGVGLMYTHVGGRR